MKREAGALKVIAAMAWEHTSLPMETNMMVNSETMCPLVTGPCIIKTVKALRENGSGEDQT
jgi:hypothetical protein